MSLARGAGNQLQVIHAVALRETRTRFGSHQLGYLWALAEPMFFILMFWGFHTLAHRPGPVGMDFYSFIATGFIGYKLVVQVAERTSKAIGGNRALLVYPRVQPLDLVAARVWLEVSTLVMAFAILMGAHAVVVGRLEIDDPLTLVHGLGLAIGLGAGLGLFFCVLEELAPISQRIRVPMMMPLFWLSGIFFTAASVPFRIREVLLLNPVMHCIEMIRAGWFRSYDAPFVSSSYVVAWIVGLSFFGLSLERVVRRKIQV